MLDSIKNKILQLMTIMIIVMAAFTYVLYEKTVSLKSDNQKLSESLNKATDANISLQSELKAVGKVQDVNNQISQEMAAAVAVIQQTSRDNQYVIRQSLKSQPCAVVKLPVDVYRMLNPERARDSPK